MLLTCSVKPKCSNIRKVGWGNKRKEKDVMKLLVSEYEVDVQGDTTNEFFVKFNGPKDSPYENVC